jgi:hypothetical protein
LEFSAVHYFYLGGSINHLMEMDHLSLLDYVKMLLALIKEYETLTGTADATPKNKIAGVGRRLFRPRMKSGDHSSHILGDGASIISSYSGGSSNNGNGGGSRSRLSSFSHNHMTTNNNTQSTTEFQHLKVYHLPFIPDVYETFVSLCETLIEAFKYVNTLVESAPPAIYHESYETLCKVDEKIRKNVIMPTVKDIDSLSRSLIYEETTKLDGLLIQAK